MALRSNPATKLAEMSRQQRVIEEKKREIEAKQRAATSDPSAAVPVANRSLEAEKQPAFSLSPASSSRRMFEAHKQSFRVGVPKGESLGQSPATLPSNAFENDGSFIEMFRQLQQKHAASLKPTPADSGAPPDASRRSKSGAGGDSNSGSGGSSSSVSGGGGSGDGGGQVPRVAAPADHRSAGSGGSADCSERSRGRGSRWGAEHDRAAVPPVGMVAPTPGSTVATTAAIDKTPQLIAYARRVFGDVDLTDDQWKQCRDQMKMNVLLEGIKQKKAEAERLSQRGKVKYDYDSDEDIEGGTWEHKRRKAEMSDTAPKAEELTKINEGKHHVGDFLPPDELERFMENWRALKEDREPDMSDYREFKLKEDNMGFQMLKKMGWSEGSGLGCDGSGITTPISQQRSLDTAGVGTSSQAVVGKEDDQFEVYRKRMMLAYKFRPNPLNNPRRSYY